MEEKIIAFLNSTETTLTLGYVIPDKVEKILTDNGAEYEEIETNGWQHDFWSNFNYNGNKIVFSGSWYYGDYALTKEN